MLELNTRGIRYYRNMIFMHDNILLKTLALSLSLLIFLSEENKTHAAEPVKQNQMHQEEWRKKTIEYATAINAYQKKADEVGWDDAGEAPDAPKREHLVKSVLDAVRQANETGDFKNLREKWPPAHEPFIDILKKKSVPIQQVLLLPDKRILVRIGSEFEGLVFLIEEEKYGVITD